MAKKKFDNDGNELGADADVTEAAAEQPAQPVDPNAVLAALAASMQQLVQLQAAQLVANAAAPADSRLTELMTQLTTALVRMSDSNMEGSQLIAAEHRRATQAVRPSNQIIPGISVFNRRGEMLADYQKPKLKCLMMLPWIAEWESLTREEVELLNLLQAGQYVVKRIDRSRINVTVAIEYKTNGDPSRLVMNHETAFNNDNFKMMPPLADILRDILKQHDRSVAKEAAAILSDEEEEALIEAGELTISA